jgi:Domain of unknown function (DUF4440)
MNAGDTEALAALLDKDLTYVHSTGLIDTREAYPKLMRDGSLVYHASEVEAADLTLARDHAIFIGLIRLHLTWFGAEKRIHNFYTNIWARRPSGWKLFLWQLTGLPQPQ